MRMGNILRGQTNADLQKMQVQDTELSTFSSTIEYPEKIAWQHTCSTRNFSDSIRNCICNSHESALRGCFQSRSKCIIFMLLESVKILHLPTQVWTLLGLYMSTNLE